MSSLPLLFILFLGPLGQAAQCGLPGCFLDLRLCRWGTWQIPRAGSVKLLGADALLFYGTLGGPVLQTELCISSLVVGGRVGDVLCSLSWAMQWPVRVAGFSNSRCLRYLWCGGNSPLGEVLLGLGLISIDRMVAAVHLASFFMRLSCVSVLCNISVTFTSHSGAMPQTLLWNRYWFCLVSVICFGGKCARHL